MQQYKAIISQINKILKRGEASAATVTHIWQRLLLSDPEKWTPIFLAGCKAHKKKPTSEEMG